MTSAIVIEDDRDAAETLAECLMLRGINVLAIGKNGADAILLYKKFRPDFVLSDLAMPYYDGVYGLKEIVEFDSEAKVIIVSASCTRADEERLIELGACALIEKPYDIRNLVSTMLEQNKKKMLTTLHSIL
jgi:two-component system chemotaxis response regulator CheY